MTTLILSPDFASHYRPMATVGGAIRRQGGRVVVATGRTMRRQVEADGFEWRELRLGAASNAGIVERTPAVDRFLDATRQGPVATLRLQAADRAADLLWQPERVAADVAAICADVEPDHTLVDQVSFASTLAMYATGRPFSSVVPGHPTQLPVGEERYGVPPVWPSTIAAGADDVAELEHYVDHVTYLFTARWNQALRAVAPHAAPVHDAFRVHGERVLYNWPSGLRNRCRDRWLPERHRFAGPLVRTEPLPTQFSDWAIDDGSPRAYVALGTFLSHRSDVLAEISDALRRAGVRAAIASGPTDPAALGPQPTGWIVAPTLPQVALLEHADLAIHHGGNNSVQESLAAGVRQLVVPFSTDQFSTAADLERAGVASVLEPNGADAFEFTTAVERLLDTPPQQRVEPLGDAELAGTVTAASPAGR